MNIFSWFLLWPLTFKKKKSKFLATQPHGAAWGLRDVRMSSAQSKNNKGQKLMKWSLKEQYTDSTKSLKR